MKYKTTKKAVLANNAKVYQLGYCELQELFAVFGEPTAYTSGVYGWNCDVYEMPEYCIAITTGYRPFGKIVPQKYIEKAKQKIAELEPCGYERNDHRTRGLRHILHLLCKALERDY